MITTLRNMATDFQLFKIIEKLQAITHDGIFAKAIRDGAKSNPREAIKMIIEQTKDNYEMVARIVGKELLETIVEIFGA